ncbi:MAG: phosphate acyltransferase PlsX [Alphaproteobacteria bacterium]|nr:phosphate acyltransferase PlsX [Alphaproteobacteria bacterium]
MILTLALDAMGGDAGPEMVVKGADLALRQAKDLRLRYLFFGDDSSIEAELKKYPSLHKISDIIHSETIITNQTKPAIALRSGRKSNMGMAIDAVAKGEANAVISAGNTGAYMALSKILLKTIDGIDRPAIPAILPTIKGKTVVLDLGANIDCTPENLVQFALMGEAFARQLLDIERPSVGLLNIGSEELKGNATVQAAAQLLKEFPDLNFQGFVEGDDITSGKTDVVVTDGFSGNIALKSIEGAAKLIGHFLKDSLNGSFRGKLGYIVAKPAFRQLQTKSDPRLYNGAVFLGLKGIAVKSHGGTDFVGFANAIGVAISMIQHNFIKDIEERLSILTSKEERLPISTLTMEI